MIKNYDILIEFKFILQHCRKVSKKPPLYILDLSYFLFNINFIKSLNRLSLSLSVCLSVCLSLSLSLSLSPIFPQYQFFKFASASSNIGTRVMVSRQWTIFCCLPIILMQTLGCFILTYNPKLLFPSVILVETTISMSENYSC